jgi:hypothetical protein
MISAAAYVLKVKRTFAQGIVTGRPRSRRADEGARRGLGAKPRARSGISRMRPVSGARRFLYRFCTETLLFMILTASMTS